ncbi:sugar transferase [Longispora sp. K20-0274]|uniref:sugar transferase n=1 Tax=Longispora sp. K20-0274 TaxID=3088255 RepID=UPI003999593E
MTAHWTDRSPGPFTPDRRGVAVARAELGRAGPGRAELGKRVFDIVVASVCVLLFSPLLLLTWLCVQLTNAGGAIFTQERLGLHGRPFGMHKFRTMTADCDDTIHREFVASELRAGDPRGGTHKLVRDPRVTRLGRFLRRTSIDELPQLFNVLAGDMSLVGPRPMLGWELELVDAAYSRRFVVPPGITGLWQISGRDRLTLIERLDLDLDYVDRHGFAVDLRILARTVIVVLTPGGAS